MTIAGQPPLQRTSARREALRAALAAFAAAAGGALWVLAEASRGAVGPLGAYDVPAAPVAPLAWGLGPETWTGLAGLAANLPPAGSWALRLVALVLLAAAALAIVHPGAIERPAPYVLPPFRRAVAWGTSILIGAALPATALLLTGALTGDPGLGTAMDAGAAFRIGIGLMTFCAVLWSLAGRGVFNPRALLRLSHGGVAGMGIFGALGIAAVATRPLTDLASLTASGNVFSVVDAALGQPGATWGWLLGATMGLSAAGLALAAAVAVTGAPQSMGGPPRRGSGMVAAVALAVLLAAATLVGRGAGARAVAAAPDLVATLDLDRSGPPRPVILLLGEEHAAYRLPPRAALLPVDLAADCAPAPPAGERPLPAATSANVAKLARFRAQIGGELSGRAARALNCEAALRARLFEPGEARRLIFTDPQRSRVGYTGFRLAVRGLLEHVHTGRARALLAQLADTTRYASTPAIRRRIEAIVGQAVGASATLTGRLAVPDPALWRVGIVASEAPQGGGRPWSVSPRTDGLVLEYMAAAVSPAADGSFGFADLPPGWYQLALLAPEGTPPIRAGTLSVTGDPGQLYVDAASRRDLGTIRISYQ